MKLDRMDVVLAAEDTGLREGEYTIRGDYPGPNLTPCVGVTLNPAHVISFMVSLALVLAENGRAEDARKLAEKTNTETLSLPFTVYWPGVELAD